jgi:hypothetical protein
MAKVKLKDGSIVDIPIQKGWGDEAVQRAIREYKTNPDPSETDPLGTYTAKEAGSIARGGGGGFASTADMLKDTFAVGPRIAYNWWNEKPLLSGFGGTPVRDAYEANVPAQPRGSDYETTAKVAEVAVPAIAETALTGSPKSILWRAPRDVALGIGGGYAGEEAGRRIGGSEAAGELGRIFGSMIAPGMATRSVVRAVTPFGWLTRPLRRFGLDPFALIPPSTPADVAQRALTGSSASSAFDYEENR